MTDYKQILINLEKEIADRASVLEEREKAARRQGSALANAYDLASLELAKIGVKISRCLNS